METKPQSNFYEVFGQPNVLYQEMEMNEETGEMQDKTPPPSDNGVLTIINQKDEETKQDDSEEQPKKEKRRKRDASVIPQVEMQELNYWRTVAMENEERLRHQQQQLEQSYYYLQQEADARQRAEMEALNEREAGLKFQKGVAELAGEREYAEQAQEALIEAALEKKLKNYLPQHPQQNFYQPPVYQPQQEIRKSPFEQMREDAFYSFQNQNRWYGTDENLTPLMKNIFSRLNSVYSLNNDQQSIGTPSYYEHAMDQLRNELGIAQQSSPPPQPVSQQQNSFKTSYPTTAAVDRGANTMADLHNSRTHNQMQVTPEDIKRLRSSNLSMLSGLNGELKGDAMVDEIIKNQHRVKQHPSKPYTWIIED